MNALIRKLYLYVVGTVYLRTSLSLAPYPNLRKPYCALFSVVQNRSDHNLLLFEHNYLRSYCVLILTTYHWAVVNANFSLSVLLVVTVI